MAEKGYREMLADAFFVKVHLEGTVSMVFSIPFARSCVFSNHAAIRSQLLVCIGNSSVHRETASARSCFDSGSSQLIVVIMFDRVWSWLIVADRRLSWLIVVLRE